MGWGSFGSDESSSSTSNTTTNENQGDVVSGSKEMTTATDDNSYSNQFGMGQQFSAGAGATVSVQDQGAIEALKELVGGAMSNVKSALGITAQTSETALQAVSASKGVPSTFADYAKWLVPAVVVVVLAVLWFWKGKK
jgi:hypothetical protein